MIYQINPVGPLGQIDVARVMAESSNGDKIELLMPSDVAFVADRLIKMLKDQADGLGKELHFSSKVIDNVV